MTHSVRKACLAAAVLFASVLGFTSAASAQVDCPVSHNQLKSALKKADQNDTTGLNNHFWAVVVNRGGVVCAVAFSGDDVGDQWLLSRQIAAAKAFTANGLSLPGAPISSGQLYPWVQPSPSGGNPLFGLAEGNPVDERAAYAGAYAAFGTASDPMIGQRIGGTITFGGGVALYDGTTPVGAVGLSGDTACADHSTAWRTRNILNKRPTAGNDKVVFSDTAGHPRCPNDEDTLGREVSASS